MRDYLYSVLYPDKSLSDLKPEYKMFYLHNKKFTPVLNDIRQTTDQRLLNLKTVLQKTAQSEKITEAEKLSFITIPKQNNSDVPILETTKIFLAEADKVTAKIPMPDGFNFPTFSFQFCDLIAKKQLTPLISESGLEKFKEQRMPFLPISLHPAYQEAVKSLSEAIHIESLPALIALYKFCDINEIIVCLAFEQNVAVYVGASTFIRLFFTLHQKGNLTSLLQAAVQSIQMANAKPLVNVAGNVLYEHRNTIGFSLLLGVVLGVGANSYLSKIPVIEAVKDVAVVKVQEIAAVSVSKSTLFISGYLPTNPEIKAQYDMIHSTVKSTFYMLGSIVSAPPRAFFVGFFEDILRVVNILDGTTTSLPAITNAVNDTAKEVAKEVVIDTTKEAAKEIVSELFKK
jgi:hypothetical protein